MLELSLLKLKSNVKMQQETDDLLNMTPVDTTDGLLHRLNLVTRVARTRMRRLYMRIISAFAAVIALVAFGILVFSAVG
jgi:hypothetical protein